MGGLDKWLIYTWASSPYLHPRCDVDRNCRTLAFVHSVPESAINYGDSKKGPFNEIGEILQILLIEKLGFNGKDDDGDGYVDEEDETEAIFRSISNLITTRSNCFTIISQGKVMRSEEVVAEKKLKVVVDRGTSPIKIKYHREFWD